MTLGAAAATLFAVRRLLLTALFLAACDGGSGPVEPPMEDRAAHCPERDPVMCAEDVGGLFPFTRHGSTVGLDDQYGDAPCVAGGGVTIEDVSFRWTAPWAGRFTFSTEGSAIDTVLTLRQGACGGRALACSDDAAGGAHSELTADLDECETITVVVDGAGVDDVGDFTLRVTGYETLCGNGVDDDLDGLTDCDDDDCFTPECAEPGDDWPEDWTALEWGVLEETNARRAEGAVCGGEEFGPAGPLEMDPLLRLSARLHSKDMAEQNYFSHDSLDGRMLGDRVAATGFGGTFLGENIARGQPTARAVVDAWMDSEGHCRNIMNPGFHFLGVGHALSTGGEPFWTQNFAGNR